LLATTASCGEHPTDINFTSVFSRNLRILPFYTLSAKKNGHIEVRVVKITELSMLINGHPVCHNFTLIVP